MTIYYEDRRTRKDGLQFWVVKGPDRKWIKIAGARTTPAGKEIYEQYARHTKKTVNHIDKTKEVSKDAFVAWFEHTFQKNPFTLAPTPGFDPEQRSPINQVEPEFYLAAPFNQLWNDPRKLYDYAQKAF